MAVEVSVNEVKATLSKTGNSFINIKKDPSFVYSYDPILVAVPIGCITAHEGSRAIEPLQFFGGTHKGHFLHATLRIAQNVYQMKAHNLLRMNMVVCAMQNAFKKRNSMIKYLYRIMYRL